MSTIKVVLRKEKKRKNGHLPIYIRMTRKRKHKYISLGQAIDPAMWDKANQRVRKQHPNASLLNTLITTKKAEVERLALEQEVEQKPMGSKSLRSTLIDGSGESFFDFAEKFLQRLQAEQRFGTYKTYQSVLSGFRKWLKAKQCRDGLTFDQLNHDLVRAYKAYLDYDKGLSPTTITHKLGAIRSICNHAIEAGLVSLHYAPFKGIRNRVVKSTKKIPSVEEMAALRGVELESGCSEFHARNMYLFSASMAGLRFSDVVTLRWSNVLGERLQWSTRKTKKQRLVYIPQDAQAILESYRRKGESGVSFVFPWLAGLEMADEEAVHGRIAKANELCNRHLYEAWKRAGVRKRYSFHTARHFFATDSLRNGMRIEVLQALLTHSSLEQTREYAQIANADMDGAMRAYEEAKGRGNISR